jgi:hypothetical protein
MAFLAAPGLTFLVLAEWTDPIAADALDLTEPRFTQRADLSRELHFCDFRAVVRAVTLSGQQRWH